MPNLQRSVAQRRPNGTVSSPSTAQIERLTERACALRLERRYVEAAQGFATLADLMPGDWLAQHNAGAVLVEAERYDEAVVFLARSVALRENVATYNLQAHALALRGDISGSRRAYENAVRLAPQDFSAHWGLFEVTQLLDDNAAALHHQRIALAQRTLVSSDARVQPPRTTVLELCIAGTFQANIPLDFILDRDHVCVHKLFVGEYPIPQLPPYDIVFNTIAEASNAGAALRAAEAFLAGQKKPVLNAPRLIPLTSRAAVAKRFADSPTVAVAPTVQAGRMNLRTMRPAYPFLVRPLDSHAGNDLAKIHDAIELDAYLREMTDVEDFYLTAFIDYRNADGYFRKYRIAFVDGVPYPVHLAISPRWMIHYYNAPMAEHAWMRAEEHAFMHDMAAVFDGPRATALREIAQALPLDYFGIDCSIAADGRVLLFEASTAMIVHTRDPVDLYPYKARYVPRIAAALARLFDERLAHSAGN